MPVPGVRPGRAGIGGPRSGQGREGEAGVYINNNTPGTGQGGAPHIGRGYQDGDVWAPDVTDDTDIQDDVTWLPDLSISAQNTPPRGTQWSQQGRAGSAGDLQRPAVP